MFERVRTWFKDLGWLERHDWDFVCFLLFMIAVNIVVFAFAFGSWVVVFPLLAAASVVWVLITSINRAVTNNKAMHKARMAFEKALKDFEEFM